MTASPAVPDVAGPLDPYDAVLLVSFGGPEAPADVLPFLRNVTRGRGIPDERLAEVAEHYLRFGGRSPINEQCRTLLAALGATLSARGATVPLYWGNRNWSPMLADTLADLRDDGHRRVLAVTTSAYPSYSSCRQYREDLAAAVADTDTDPAGAVRPPVQIDRIRHYALHPGFVSAVVDAVLDAVDRLPDRPSGVRLVFVTHSIPTAMAAGSGTFVDPGAEEPFGYLRWHQSVASEVTAEVSARAGSRPGSPRDGGWAHDLVFCSRSGPPQQPWLEPDVNDHLRALAARAAADGSTEPPAVVIVPIGFVSDHMEVIFDLDTEALATAAELGLTAVRAATAGVHPAFVDGLVDLVSERAAVARGEDPPRPQVGPLAVAPELCRADCCPNLRAPHTAALAQASRATR